MSSREELLNEAIAKAKEAEDWQLADWLRMARGGESAARWYAEKLRELKAENAKLREVIGELSENLLFSCGECWLRGDVRTCDNKNCGNHKTYRKMCALGIEVE